MPCSFLLFLFQHQILEFTLPQPATITHPSIKHKPSPAATSNHHSTNEHHLPTCLPRYFNMQFFSLPTELRLMIYKEVCPSRLYFPYSIAQDGLQFLAVSRLIRQEILPCLRNVSSVILKLRNSKDIDDFLLWLQPNPSQGFVHLTTVHLTELAIEGWFHYNGFGGTIAFSKVQHRVRIHDSTNSLKFLLEIPRAHEQIWAYRESLLVTRTGRTDFNCHVWMALNTLVKTMSGKLEYENIERIIRTAIRYLDISLIQFYVIKNVDTELPRPIHYVLDRQIRRASAVRQMLWKEWKNLTYADGDEMIDEQMLRQPLWTARELACIRASEY